MDLELAITSDHYAGSWGGYEDYCADQLLIETKRGGEEIPLLFNKPQRFVGGILEEQRARLGYNRAIILKARRLGMSTMAISRLYWMATNFPNTRCKVVAHLDSTTQELWHFVELFQQSVDPRLRIRASTDTQHSLWFDAIRSGISVATAGSRTVGRGGTNQGLLLSEAAYYPATHAWRAGILKTVHRAPGTFIAIESTAHGKSGDFYELWEAAVKKDIEYEPIFLPWFWGEDNTYPVPKGFKPTREEWELVAEFPEITHAHLMWRRLEMKELELDPTKAGDPIDLFHQEHPATPEEAFISSGNARFSFVQLQKAKAAQQLPKYRAEVELGSGRLTPAERGRLLVWEDPRVDRTYGISGDVAKGTGVGDNSSMHVVDMHTGKTVAAWADNNMDAEEFGVLINWVGRRYGGMRKAAEAIIESNGIGWSTLKKLQSLNYPYIWQREAHAGAEADKNTRWGFETTPQTKPTLIQALASDLRDDPTNMVDPWLIAEMETFVRIHNENRPDLPPRQEAARGKRDDRVISRALASFLYRQRAGKRVITEAEKKYRQDFKAMEDKHQRADKLLKRFRIHSPAPKTVSVDELFERLRQVEAEKAVLAPGVHDETKLWKTVPEAQRIRRKRRFGG